MEMKVSDVRQERPDAAAYTGSDAAPRLASDVDLLGELRGSGFAEPQWLARRSGRYLQLSELLYRVASEVDGERTLAEVAARVTDSTKWQVTAENVRQVIELKLVPLGLVAPTGAVAPPREASRETSPLRISGRRRLLAPGAVNRVSRLVAVLFSPLVLVPALILVVAAHAWLYLVRGAGESIHKALYTPGGLLLVLGLMLLSSLVHELGHAAALRRGGGRPGAIGGGFYLVYPTLYTDTTDAYRLGRAARLRTDLGGLYFQLLFALAIAGVALVARQPVLLAVIVLIDLEILYQFLPTARLDGYWAVADLVGIPDPFSQLGSQVRSSVAPHASATRAPRIKRWAAVVVGVYLTISLALATAVFALTIADFPQILVKVSRVFRHNGGSFGEAISGNDFLVVAALAAQLLVLALITVAVCSVVYRGGRTIFGALWSWSVQSARRRAAGAMMASVLVTAVSLLWATGFFWAPRIPLSLGSNTPAAPSGTRTFDVSAGRPVSGSVAYEHHPPVGGRYAVQWQNCGFYDAPIADDRAVHSLARGAVWIAYRPGLAQPEVALLHAVAQQLGFVLSSPYKGLRAPVVMTAWGRQLALQGVGDPRLAGFIAAFRQSPRAPEAGRPCIGGVGKPLRGASNR
jgi:putative peptide zinc metalloprotease protein